MSPRRTWRVAHLTWLCSLLGLMTYMTRSARFIEWNRAITYWGEVHSPGTRVVLEPDIPPLLLRSWTTGGSPLEATLPLAVPHPGKSFWLRPRGHPSQSVRCQLTLRAACPPGERVPVHFQFAGGTTQTFLVGAFPETMTLLLPAMDAAIGTRSRDLCLQIRIPPGRMRSPFGDLDPMWLEHRATQAIRVQAWPGSRAEIAIGDARWHLDQPGLLIQKSNDLIALAWVPRDETDVFPEDQWPTQSANLAAHLIPGAALAIILGPDTPFTMCPMDTSKERTVVAEVRPSARWLQSGVWISRLRFVHDDDEASSNR